MLERYLWQSAVFIGAPLDRIRGRAVTSNPFTIPGGIPTLGDEPNQLMAADLFSYLQDDILHITDRMSMAVSLEAREPLLDHRIVEFAARISSSLKINQRRRQGKICFKQAIRGTLPDSVLERPKHGFGSPIKVWMGKGLDATINEIFRDSAAVRGGLVDGEGVRRYLAEGDDYDEVRRDLRLWTLLTLELWARVFLDGNGEKPSFTLDNFAPKETLLKKRLIV